MEGKSKIEDIARQVEIALKEVRGLNEQIVAGVEALRQELIVHYSAAGKEEEPKQEQHYI